MGAVYPCDLCGHACQNITSAWPLHMGITSSDLLRLVRLCVLSCLGCCHGTYGIRLRFLGAVCGRLTADVAEMLLLCCGAFDKTIADDQVLERPLSQRFGTVAVITARVLML
jgi:hypothetical protein